jgi:ATP-dependent Clp protease, protease subunit
MGKRFWTIQAAKGNPKAGEVMLYGPIASQTWFGDEVTPKAFADDLKALGDVDTITLYINSEGGDVFAAQAIYSMLKRHSAAVHTYVDGLAASAASLIAMAGETITLPINAMLMLHSPWAFAMGNASQLRTMADDLDKIRESMIAVYSERSGKSHDEVVAILDAETWYTAEEAVAAGFADEVEGAKQIAASITDNTLTINGQQVDLRAFRSFPADKVAATAEAPAEDEPAAEEATDPAPADAVQEPAEAPAEQSAPAEEASQARLRLLRLRARV